jgi:RHS repeat-associated protein
MQRGFGPMRQVEAWRGTEFSNIAANLRSRVTHPASRACRSRQFRIRRFSRQPLCLHLLRDAYLPAQPACTRQTWRPPWPCRCPGTGPVEPQTVAQYTYDAFGQRVAKSQPATSTTTLYQFDQLGSLLEESNTQGNPAPSDYIYLDDGRPVATLTPVAGNLYFLHDDRFGTPQLATDSSQAVAWRMNYQPFGQTGNVQDSLVQPQNLRLPGQQADAESGIYHNGFRDYVPNLGRYIESDPIGIAGGINTYAYAGANPLANTAPQGLSTFRAFLYTMDKQGDDAPRRQACGTLSGIFGHDGGPHDERFYRHGGTPSRP